MFFVYALRNGDAPVDIDRRPRPGVGRLELVGLAGRDRIYGPILDPDSVQCHHSCARTEPATLALDALGCVSLDATDQFVGWVRDTGTTAFFVASAVCIGCHPHYAALGCGGHVYVTPSPRTDEATTRTAIVHELELLVGDCISGGHGHYHAIACYPGQFGI